MNKKLLFVTTKHSVFEEPIKNTFLYFGFDVKMIDFRDSVILMPETIIHRLVSKLPGKIKSNLYQRAYNSVDRKILKVAHEFKPDYIFVLKAKDISIATLDELRKIGKTMNYYPETMDHWEVIKKISPHYDYFLNYDSFVVDLLNKNKLGSAHYIPFSADLNKSDEWQADVEYKYSIAFVGSFLKGRYSEREKILDKVKDLGLHIWGNKAWLETSLKNYYRGRPSTEEMLKIYHDSKIVINVDLMPGTPGTGVNLRPFEVTAAGSLLLNHDDRKDIYNLFADGREFASFKGPEDIREKTQYYLDHNEERLRIAKAGFERTKRDHTYLDSFKKIIEIIQ